MEMMQLAMATICCLGFLVVLIAVVLLAGYFLKSLRFASRTTIGYREALGLQDWQPINVSRVLIAPSQDLKAYVKLVYNRGHYYVPVLTKRVGVGGSRAWDRAQVIATGLVVAEHFGGNVPFGVLLLGSEGWEKVECDEENVSWVRWQLRAMREIEQHNELPARPEKDKCYQCRSRDECWSLFPRP